ncbi:hypothetical protein TIFTF001_052474 [Ficus carica]|uniref:Uncharacterized protein n=1 Tax=Ficus carica TaxID=3494 RepID=A0AA88EIP7_FICCA|nr:hypothetical protein TIFTF001_052474 [Ficus carica]
MARVVGCSGSEWAFRGLGCSGRPDRVGYGITQGDYCRRQQGQPLPGQVAAGGDVTRCRSGQAEPAVDGTCVRKVVTGGARAPRALSLWNALVRRGSSGILVFWSAIRLTWVDGALRQDGEARAPIKPSVNEVWSALLGSDIR